MEEYVCLNYLNALQIGAQRHRTRRDSDLLHFVSVRQMLIKNSINGVITLKQKYFRLFWSFNVTSCKFECSDFN